MIALCARTCLRILLVLCAVLILFAAAARAQPPEPAQPPHPGNEAAQPPAQPPEPGSEPAQPTAPQPAFSQAELEQLVAPIALYPDPLLSQIFMASTYPLEVVEAARWVKEHPDLTGDALEQAMAQQPWDASVKSLTNFPDVLAMMNDELAWTQKLGDAFLAQQDDVLDAVQTLRARAEEAGTLKTTEQQTVSRETVTQPGGGTETVYVIEPANPQTVYVPAYNPEVAYGGWPYSDYPPYSYYPSGYVAGGSALWFGAGVAAGAALWGGFDWGRGYANINIDRYNRYYHTRITNPRWQHNVEHRRGVNYRSPSVARRYGRETGVRAREQFRGRAEMGRRELAPGRPGVRPGQRPGAEMRPGMRPGERPGAVERRGERPGAGKRPAERPGAAQRRGERPGAAKRPAERPGAAQRRGERPGAAKRPAERPGAAQRRGERPGAARRPAQRPAQRARPSSRQGARPPAAYRGMGQGNRTRQYSSRGRSSRQAMRSGSRSRPHRAGRGRR